MNEQLTPLYSRIDTLYFTIINCSTLSIFTECVCTGNFVCICLVLLGCCGRSWNFTTGTQGDGSREPKYHIIKPELLRLSQLNLLLTKNVQKDSSSAANAVYRKICNKTSRTGTISTMNQRSKHRPAQHIYPKFPGCFLIASTSADHPHNGASPLHIWNTTSDPNTPRSHPFTGAGIPHFCCGSSI